MKKSFFRQLNSRQRHFTGFVSTEAEKRGVKAYLVGGVVRDLLLGKEVEDLDFVVEGNGVSFAKALAGICRAQVKTYADFGTATLILEENFRVDFASTRSETYSRPGSLPSVKPGNLEDDLARRDFTVNAMALAVQASQKGEIVDPFDGQADLRGKKIRILHEKSFVDDPTRVLRAVRFEQRFGFKLEKQTLARLKSAVKKKADRTVKFPRYFAEFKKMLKEKDPVPALRRSMRLGILRFLPVSRLPAARLKRITARLKNPLDSFDVDRHGWLMYCMGLFEDSTITKVVKFCQEAQMSNSEQRAAVESLRARAAVKELSGRRMNPSRIFSVLDPFCEETIHYIFLSRPSVTVRKRVRKYWKDLRNMKLSLNGDDLKEMGYRPGKDIGRALEELKDRKLDGKIRTKRDELKQAREWLKKGKEN